MSFGGFFGGGSGSGSGSSSSSSSTSSNTSTQIYQPSQSTPSSQSNTDSSQIRQRLQTAIAIQANVANAKFLINKVNENCFANCVPSPGTSLSSKEQTCLSACMEKYIDAWNVTSKTYINRLHREGAQLQGMTGGAGATVGGPGVGKELF